MKKKLKNFITLGIETSCDETACAVLRGDDTLLSSVVASSLDLHSKFGGVVPEIASRHCLEYIQVVYNNALQQAGVKQEDIDLIAATYGPGLVGSLLVGLSFAKGLSYALHVPYIGVNHLEGHLYANFIRNQALTEPFIGLLISGGHTSIVYCKNEKISQLGETRDDAIGEAFDKVAKMLGLGYPGGPIIQKIAENGDPDRIKFTCAKLPGSLDFSFSGIKTGVLYYAQKSHDLAAEIPDICAAFQKSVTRVVVDKVLAAAAQKKVKHIVVGGGVSANAYLREQLAAAAERQGIAVMFPVLKEAIDNGAMIARRGFELYCRGKTSPYSLSAQSNLTF